MKEEDDGEYEEEQDNMFNMANNMLNQTFSGNDPFGCSETRHEIYSNKNHSLLNDPV
jgi:hypothetical protein